MMEKIQVAQFFQDSLKQGNLSVGTNYLIDTRDMVWLAVCWVNGGIWFIKSFHKGMKNKREYYRHKALAVKRSDTVWEKR